MCDSASIHFKTTCSRQCTVKRYPCAAVHTQGLLGAFYYIEAAVLLEDFHEAVPHSHDGPFYDVHFYKSSDITAAYHDAA